MEFQITALVFLPLSSWRARWRLPLALAAEMEIVFLQRRRAELLEEKKKKKRLP